MVALMTILYYAYRIYYYMILAYIIMSWLPQLAHSPIGELLARLVEPYLRPFRRLIPPIGMIDISPIAALIALWFIYLGANSVLGYLFTILG
ncbi:YggT family protein [Tepidibacillus sp. LV47]|uniref:YggT family protein n=1 Tax=Tepidibacillus sp. LV47 TaxID=3398228 RepID=UPI003AAC57AE